MSAWTAQRIAQRLQLLVDEHGAPNWFQLSEVAGGPGRKMDVLDISRLARLEMPLINEQLSRAGVSACYEARRSADAPACIRVERVAGS